MENVLYGVAGRYADITKTMWFTFLYAPGVPFGVLLSLGSLLCFYWIDKVIFIFSIFFLKKSIV